VDEAFEDGNRADGSAVDAGSCVDAGVVDGVLLGVSSTVTVVGFTGIAVEGSVTVWTMVVGATAAEEV